MNQSNKFTLFVYYLRVQCDYFAYTIVITVVVVIIVVTIIVLNNISVNVFF